MPKLVKKELIDLLKNKVNTMEGTINEIVEELNANTQNGYVYNNLDSQEVLNILGAETYNTIKDSSNEYAKMFLGYLEYPNELNLEPNSEGYNVVNELVLAGLLSEQKKDYLIEAAKEENMSGPSWGKQNGIGRIHVSFVLQVLEGDE